MNRIFVTVALLCCSNIFMTFAWYGHLKNLSHKPWIIAAIVSWGIALFEYLLQVPANRIGHSALSVGQLKILQEVITLLVFVPFSVLFLKEKITLDYLWAGVCLLGAVFFLFKSRIFGIWEQWLFLHNAEYQDCIKGFIESHSWRYIGMQQSRDRFLSWNFIRP